MRLRRGGSSIAVGESSPSSKISPDAKQQAVGGLPVSPQAGRLRRVVNNALNRGRSTGQELRPRSPKKRASREKSTSSNSPGDPTTPAAKQQNLEESPIKQVAVGIAMGARSLAAGVAALGARALGGGASPMVADGMAARSRVLSPSQVLPLAEQEDGEHMCSPLHYRLPDTTQQHQTHHGYSYPSSSHLSSHWVHHCAVSRRAPAE